VPSFASTAHTLPFASTGFGFAGSGCHSLVYYRPRLFDTAACTSPPHRLQTFHMFYMFYTIPRFPRFASFPENSATGSAPISALLPSFNFHYTLHFLRIRHSTSPSILPCHDSSANITFQWRNHVVTLSANLVPTSS
jgi:hypothetical protein